MFVLPCLLFLSHHVLLPSFSPLLDGQYEIKDVTALTVAESGTGTPSQDIIVNSALVESSLSQKTCYDASNEDTNVCVVQFLLKDDFYRYTSFSLTGNGYVLLEFGDASGNRRQLQAASSTSSNTDDTAAAAADPYEAFGLYERWRPTTEVKKDVPIPAPFQIETLDFVVVRRPTSGNRPATEANVKKESSSSSKQSSSAHLLHICFIVIGSVVGVLLGLYLTYTLLIWNARRRIPAVEKSILDVADHADTTKDGEIPPPSTKATDEKSSPTEVSFSRRWRRRQRQRRQRDNPPAASQWYVSLSSLFKASTTTDRLDESAGADVVAV